MRIPFLKLGALSAVMFLAACQTTPSAPSPTEPPPPANPNFAAEIGKFDAQFPNEKATKYEVETLRFNNAQKLDEKGDCHGKSIHPVTIVLLLDASGRVTSSITSVENAKAACFTKAYAGVQFPKPPIAPYRKPILLR